MTASPPVRARPGDPEPASEPSPSVPPGSAGTLLVVDDHPGSLFLARRILEHQGYHVLAARDGHQALEALRGARPDAIILDYMMPGMDGPEVLCRIRGMSEHRHTPVLLLTASADTRHIGRAFRAGAQDFITRPVDWQVLGARVRAAIELEEARRKALEAERRREVLLQDLVEARDVQQSQLPHVPQVCAGWRLTGTVVPSGTVGGDLFAFTHQRGGRARVVLIDVCGHGVAAALVAAELVAELKSALSDQRPRDALALLNDRLAASPSGRYAAVALVELGAGHVSIANAGLPPVCLIRRGVIAHRVFGSGVPPGLLPDQTYEQVRIEVEAGDRLVLMSDGLTEPFGPADDVGGCADVMRLLGEGWNEFWSPQGIHGLVHERLGRRQVDDATMILLERIDQDENDDSSVVRRIFDASGRAIRPATEWVLDHLPGNIDRTLADVGLTEVITNAVVHGVLGVASHHREGNIAEYLHKAGHLVKNGLTIEIERRMDDEAAHIRVRWVGNPCPEEKRSPRKDLRPLEASGRGMLIIDSTFDEVRWLDEGRGMELVLRPAPSVDPE